MGRLSNQFRGALRPAVLAIARAGGFSFERHLSPSSPFLCSSRLAMISHCFFTRYSSEKALPQSSTAGIHPGASDLRRLHRTNPYPVQHILMSLWSLLVVSRISFQAEGWFSSRWETLFWFLGQHIFFVLIFLADWRHVCIARPESFKLLNNSLFWC